MPRNSPPLTVDALTGIYHGLLETYFGDAMVIDPQLDLECLRIPHFYSAFYVYKYATGIAAAITLAGRVLDGGARELEAYLNFLKAGGSMFPLDAPEKCRGRHGDKGADPEDHGPF